MYFLTLLNDYYNKTFRKNDQKLKISEDPLTDIQAALSIQPKGKSQSTSQSSKSTKSKRMKREEIEHARAKSLLSSSSKR